MGAIVVGNKLEVLTHVVTSGLKSAALLALAINIGAGNILAHNCIAVSAQNIVGAIVVGSKLEVLTHVVTSGLRSAAGLALAINVNAAKLVYSFSANSADDLVGAMVGALVLPAVGHVVAGSAADLALAINVGAGNILAQNCIAVSAQNIVGAIVVGNKLEVLLHVVASGLLSMALDALAICVVGAGNILAHNCTAAATCNIVGAVVVGNKAIVRIHVVTSGIRSVTFRALAIHKKAALLLFQLYLAIVTDYLVSGAVFVAHIGQVIVETRVRKCRRSHSKHHSTCYNKRQHTAYFFKFHKPNLLYKNNTVYFSINAVLCCATMHGRQGTLFPETKQIP